MENKHLETCNAPICAYDTNPNFKKEVVWFPGEEICGKRPYHLFQQNQELVNKYLAKGTFEYPDFSFTAEMLERSKYIYKGAKGTDPDASQLVTTEK